MPHRPARPAPRRAARIAIIGLGPRGTSLVERLGAHLRADLAPAGAPQPRGDAQRPVELHLIDDAEPGPGRIWRTDQTRELCMNTLADAVTLFTEPGSTVVGPISEGPTLYEWCILARDTAHTAPAGAASCSIPAGRRHAYAQHPARPGLREDYRDELDAMRPESHPSRALYGEYLAWCFDRAVATLPPSVTVIHHRAQATAIGRVSTDGDGERISLQGNGAPDSVTVDAVIASTGWLPRAPTSADAALSAQVADRPELVWVRDGSPVEQDLRAVRPGQPAIVRGLGMGFFDTVTLLTRGRGGRYVSEPAAPGGLRYLPSGDEPILHVTSRRGVPFRAKSRYGALPPRAPQRLLREVDWAAEPRPLDFDRLLWPRIVGDAFLAHADTLARVRPSALGAAPTPPEPRGAGSPDTAPVLAAIEAAIRSTIAPVLRGDIAPHLGDVVDAVAAAVAPYIPHPADRLPLAQELRPAERDFASPAAFNAWVRDRVSGDLAEVDLGAESPLKAGLWSISSARGLAAQIGTVGGFDAESRASGYALLSAVGGMVGSGPPAYRNNELLALAEAGIVRFIGPDAAVTVTAGGFTASSPRVAHSAITAPTLIDAWMHFHDVRRSTDPLTLSLIAAGRARPFAVAARDGRPASTAGIDIDPRTGRLIGSTGEIVETIHVAGIPVDATLHGTVISPMPGTDPPMLRETDRVSRSALDTARRAAAAAIAAAPAAPRTATQQGALSA